MTDRVWNAPARQATRGGQRRWLIVVGVLACIAGCRGETPPPVQRGKSAAAHVTVSRPTVISYFVIPAGAVDTLPDLAVEADDWNVAMAALGDSLEASGIDLAMVLDSVARVSVEGRPDTVVALGSFKSSGYIFVRPNGPICVRPGGADPDSVVAAARAALRRDGCTTNGS